MYCVLFIYIIISQLKYYKIQILDRFLLLIPKEIKKKWRLIFWDGSSGDGGGYQRHMGFAPFYPPSSGCCSSRVLSSCPLCRGCAGPSQLCRPDKNAGRLVSSPTLVPTKPAPQPPQNPGLPITLPPSSRRRPCPGFSSLSSSLLVTTLRHELSNLSGAIVVAGWRDAAVCFPPSRVMQENNHHYCRIIRLSLLLSPQVTSSRLSLSTKLQNYPSFQHYFGCVLRACWVCQVLFGCGKGLLGVLRAFRVW